MISIIKKKHAICICLSFFVTLIACLFVTKYLGTGHLFVSCLMTFLFVTSLLGCVILIVNEISIYLNADKRAPIAQAMLAFFIIAFYLPLIRKGAGFFWHDDYLNFRGFNVNFLAFSFSQGRQLTGVFTDLFSFVTFDTSYILRMFSVTGVFLYSQLLFIVVYNLTQKPIWAVAISCMLSTILPVINVVSYGSMFTYSFAFVFGAASVLWVDRAMKNKEGYIYYMMLAGINILAANFIYQVTVTVAFSILFIIIIMNNRDKVKTCRNYIIVFAIYTGIYYVALKLLNYAYKIPTMSRGNTISSLRNAMDKIKWFFMYVIPQAVRQCVASLLGDVVFSGSNYTGTLAYNDNNIAILFNLVILFIVVFSVIFVVRTSGLKTLLGALFMVPCSYYCFLILKEDGYTSYYVVALSSIVLLTLIYGGGVICDALNLKRLEVFLAVGFMFVFFVNGRYYINNYWIESNKSPYFYIKENLKGCRDFSRIHVYGTPKPGEADLYSIRAVEMALREENIDFRGEITASNNKEYNTTMINETYNILMSDLYGEDKIFIESMYIAQPEFGIYSINFNLINAESKEKLKRIFNKSGIIPEENDREILTIDLTNIQNIRTKK